jgi:hypothetical protein
MSTTTTAFEMDGLKTRLKETSKRTCTQSAYQVGGRWRNFQFADCLAVSRSKAGLVRRCSPGAKRQ